MKTLPATRTCRSSLRRARRTALAAAALLAAPAAFAQSTLWSIDGEQAGAHLGEGGIAPLGDVNGDGYADFLVGEPLYDGKAGPDCGRVQLFGGAKSSPKVLMVWEGGKSGDRFGSFVRNVRDLNGDGVDDFAIAAVGYPGGAEQGMVEVRSGLKSDVLYSFYGENAGDQFGRVCGVGDATNDSVPDVLISAIGWSKDTNGIGAGRVGLYSGADGTLHKQWSGIPGQELGFQIAAFNGSLIGFGDAGNEVVISSSYRGLVNGWGTVQVFSGEVGNGSALTHTGNPGDLAAYVTDAADVDGNGQPDYLIASPAVNGGLGWIEHWSCRGGNFDFIRRWNGTATMPYDGGMAMAGDVDGDGYGDFLFSSTGYDGPGGADVGCVQVVSGWNGRELTRKPGPESGSAMGGESIANVGDLNGDGIPDFMAAAPMADLPALDKAGKTWAYSGDDLYLTLSHETAYAGDFVTVATTGGAPGKQMICACTEIDGVPCFLLMLASMYFDANGEFVIVPLVDPSYVGHDLVFQSFGLPATGRRLEISAPVAIALR